MKTEDLRSAGWTLESPAVLALMEKLRKAGTPLGKYVQGRFYYGIKTGFNEAFVIDASTREQLIAADPNSAELIKPWLRGRDIRKWKAEWAGLYLIAIASGANRAWPWSEAKNETEARRLFAAAYPAIYTHLSQWEAQLRKRDDQGQYWWELRSCAYYAEFEQPKIVYQEIATYQSFGYAEIGCLCNNKIFLIPSKDDYLLGLLNSQLTWWYLGNLTSGLTGGARAMQMPYMEQLPVFHATDAQKSPITQRVQTILADPSSPDIPRLEAEIDELVFDLYGLTASERQLVLAARAEPCEDEIAEGNHDELQTASTTRSAPASVASQPRRRGKPAAGVSPAGAQVHPEFDGVGKRAGQPGAAGEIAASTRPLDATRELATAAGLLAYSEVAERLAVSLARCLDALLENPPADIRITPEWICGIHRSIAGDLFPEWAGHFRTTDVQVGTHLPPPGHEVAVHIKNFCLDLEERLRHLRGAESIAGLLAWADWRFQWIHPFKDFNGRVGRVMLVALAYKLALPPVDPAGEPGKAAYFAALRAADAGNLDKLSDLWLDRLLQGGATLTA